MVVFEIVWQIVATFAFAAMTLIGFVIKFIALPFHFPRITLTCATAGLVLWYFGYF